MAPPTRVATISRPSSAFEHDSCGTGFVARASGEPSRRVLDLALEALVRLEHRGAIAADGKSGDGAGVQTQIPRQLFVREAARLGHHLNADDPFAVGTVFVPPGDETSMAQLERALTSPRLSVIGWREVPVDPEALGEFAQANLPRILHILVAPRVPLSAEAFERELYLARKAYEREAPAAYICSLSCRHLVYKALCAPHQLPRFYGDLADPLFQTAFALYHQRFSTNTLPSWELAQPLRLLAHNGEINTIWGNRAWMRSREHILPHEVSPVLRDGWYGSR